MVFEVMGAARVTASHPQQVFSRQRASRCSYEYERHVGTLVGCHRQMQSPLSMEARCMFKCQALHSANNCHTGWAAQIAWPVLVLNQHLHRSSPFWSKAAQYVLVEQRRQQPIPCAVLMSICTDHVVCLAKLMDQACTK